MNANTLLEMQRLLSAHCDGDLSDADHTRLEDLLTTDAECRRIYLEYMDLHSALVLAGQNGAAREPFGTVDNSTTTAAAHASLSTPAAGPNSGRGLILYRYFLIAVASLAASILIQVYWVRPANRDGARRANHFNIQPAPIQNETTEFVATLRSAIDCSWDNPENPLLVGARLAPGKLLRLPKGVASMQFDSGPELVVEGPAEVRLESSTSATVLSGKVVVRADDSDAPFDLITPNAVHAESGPEFAVAVSAESEEVHVFEGAVRRQPKASSKGAAPEQLKAGEARKYDPTANQFGKPMKCDPKRFVRHVADPARGSGRETTAGLLAYEGFEYKNPMVLPSGKATGGKGWLGPWKAGFTRWYAEPEAMRPPLNSREGLQRAGAAIPALGGSFDYAGFATCSRRLAKAVRLDRDAHYYLSFLFQRHAPAADPFNSAGVQFWTTEDMQTQKFENARQRLFIGVKKMNQLCARLQRMDMQTPLSLNTGTTYVLVAKVTAAKAGPNYLYASVFSPDDAIPTGEPKTWALNSGPFQSELVFDYLQLHINSKARQTLDEFRLGSTWNSVTAAHRR